MASTGDSYIIILRPSHLAWGTHRYTNTREHIYGEGYIPIPKEKAMCFNVLNSNGTGGTDILGKNIFNCTSADGLFQGILKAQGNSEANNIYAKQFSVNGDLKALGKWFRQVGASTGDRIKVTWTSPYDIEIEKL